MINYILICLGGTADGGMSITTGYNPASGNIVDHSKASKMNLDGTGYSGGLKEKNLNRFKGTLGIINGIGKTALGAYKKDVQGAAEGINETINSISQMGGKTNPVSTGIKNLNQNTNLTQLTTNINAVNTNIATQSTPQTNVPQVGTTQTSPVINNAIGTVQPTQSMLQTNLTTTTPVTNTTTPSYIPLNLGTNNSQVIGSTSTALGEHGLKIRKNYASLFK